MLGKKHRAWRKVPDWRVVNVDTPTGLPWQYEKRKRNKCFPSIRLPEPCYLAHRPPEAPCQHLMIYSSCAWTKGPVNHPGKSSFSWQPPQTPWVSSGVSRGVSTIPPSGSHSVSNLSNREIFLPAPGLSRAMAIC